MQNFRDRSSSSLVTPVKSSVKYITRRSSKLWGSLVGRRRPSIPKCEPLSQSLIDYPQKSIPRRKKLTLEIYEEFGKTAKSSTPARKADQQNVNDTMKENIEFSNEEAPKDVDTFPKGGNSLKISRVIMKSPQSRDDFDVIPNLNEYFNEELKSCRESVHEQKLVDQKENVSELNRLVHEFRSFHGTPMFNRSSLRDVYELMNNTYPTFRDHDPREQLIKEKFVVNIHESYMRRQGFSPICKNKSRLSNSGLIPVSHTSSLVRVQSSIQYDTDEEAAIDPPVCCSPDELNLSFTSSHHSNDSISDLLTEDENEDEMNDASDKLKDKTDILEILKTNRNRACATIKGVSKALKLLRNSCKKSSCGALLDAERALLLSTERCKVYTRLMNDEKYFLQSATTTGTITFSKITIPLGPDVGQIYNDTYFVCVICSDLDVYATKIVQPLGREGRQYLIFKDVITFHGLRKNFKLYVKIFMIQLDFCSGKLSLRRVLPKKTTAHPVKLYSYDDLLTDTKEEDYCFLPAFKICGLFPISMENIRQVDIFNVCPGSLLHRTATIIKSLTTLKMNVEMQGLLNFGQRYGNENELIVWNMKYVVLNEAKLRIYNSPSDDEPLVIIDLRDLASELITHSCHLKYCFQIDIVYDEDPDFECAFKFPYFLKANTRANFEMWSNKLNYVINRLKQWDMLPFLDRNIIY